MHLSFLHHLFFVLLHLFLGNFIIFVLVIDFFDFSLLKNIVIRANAQIAVVHLLQDQFPNDQQLNNVKDNQNNLQKVDLHSPSQAEHDEGVHEICNDQSEEFCVIKLAYAIIQPFTMMIKF
jgi:hypothetical protein